MNDEETITPEQLEILEKLFTLPLQSDEDLLKLNEVFSDDSYKLAQSKNSVVA